MCFHKSCKGKFWGCYVLLHVAENIYCFFISWHVLDTVAASQQEAALSTFFLMPVWCLGPATTPVLNHQKTKLKINSLWEVSTLSAIVVRVWRYRSKSDSKILFHQIHQCFQTACICLINVSITAWASKAPTLIRHLQHYETIL
jgi:hypothetical protein